jgi:hypothetical protein
MAHLGRAAAPGSLGKTELRACLACRAAAAPLALRSTYCHECCVVGGESLSFPAPLFLARRRGRESDYVAHPARGFPPSAPSSMAIVMTLGPGREWRGLFFVLRRALVIREHTPSV